MKYCALTFDDGPNTTTTVEVLDKLQAHDVIASFFVIGKNITEETIPIVQRAHQMGCEINNHSETHSSMPKQTAKEMEDEITYTNDIVKTITGVTPHFFRPPYLDVNEVMFDTIHLPFIAGYCPEDYIPTISVEERYNRILSHMSDGEIILLHDLKGNSNTVALLDTLIPELKRQGYNFVTVSKLFELKQKTPVKGIVYSNTAD